jgi:hypothetical protein
MEKGLTMAEAVYVLCALTSLACGMMLFRAYRRSGQRFLLWASLCFVGLVLNNVLLYVELVVVGPDIDPDLSVPRVATALAGVGLLVFGLVWEER